MNFLRGSALGSLGPAGSAPHMLRFLLSGCLVRGWRWWRILVLPPLHLLPIASAPTRSSIRSN
jgi:hypothetical protein